MNAWEIDRLTEFLKNLELFTGITTSEDRIKWQGNNEGIFSVRSGYKEFNLSTNQIACWPWKMIWKVKISYKVSCFTCLLARGKALTQDNLCKRGHHLCSSCFLCAEKAETINHLFLHCKLTEQLWRMFLNFRGILWTMPSKIADVLACWNREGSNAIHFFL